MNANQLQRFHHPKCLIAQKNSPATAMVGRHRPEALLCGQSGQIVPTGHRNLGKTPSIDALSWPVNVVTGRHD